MPQSAYLLLPLLLVTTACGQSVDARFDAFCDEIASNPGDAGIEACKYRDNLDEAQKIQLVEAYEAVKAQREVVADIEAEGRDKGYIQD